MTMFDLKELNKFELTKCDESGLEKLEKEDPWWTNPEVMHRSQVVAGGLGEINFGELSEKHKIGVVAEYVNPDGKWYNPADIPCAERLEKKAELRSIVVTLYSVGYGGSSYLAGRNVNDPNYYLRHQCHVLIALRRCGGSSQWAIFKRVLVRLFDQEDKFAAFFNDESQTDGFANTSGAQTDGAGSTSGVKFEFLPMPSTHGHMRTNDGFWNDLL